MIVVFTGLPGSGKSTKLADVLVDLLTANKKRYEKAVLAHNKRENDAQDISFPQKRRLWTNLKFTKKIEEEFSDYICYWSDLRELIPLRDVDVAIDEIATYFDSRQWENMSAEIRRWLTQHRKFGIEIYGTAQDFAQCDKAFRRLCSHLFLLSKVFGSGDISPTRPVPKRIWGFVVIKELDPTVYDELKSKFQRQGILPSFMWITRSMTQVFDTRAEVRMSSALPLKHIEKACENNNCSFHKIIHV